MSNKSTISNKTLSCLKDKEYDTIPFRIDFIKTLLDGKEIKPLVELDHTDTESFIGINQMNRGQNKESDEEDGKITLRKKLLNFNETMAQMGGRLLYVKSGTTGHTFKGIIPEGKDEFNYGVKVVAYPKKEKYGSINDSRRPENAELLMIKLLSYFVVKKKTPHIVLPIGTFNTDIKPFINLIKEEVVDEDNKKYGEFIERYNKNEYHSEVSILISEWANRGDLLEFIRKNYENLDAMWWKVIFFQILSVLAVIHSKFPGFRHNDLKANNILMHKINKKAKRFTYKVAKNLYSVPNIQYQVKLWDFDFACIPGIIENSKVSAEWTKAINVTPEQNRYYDMHYFFNTLTNKGFFPQFMSDKKHIPQEARDFVNRVVPDQYKSGTFVHKRGRVLSNKEYLTPDDVLRTDPYFEEFRKNIKDIKNTNSDALKSASNMASNISNMMKAQKNSISKPIIQKQQLQQKPQQKPQKQQKQNKKSDISEIKLEDLLIDSD
jgi:hypothetical protein